MPQVNTSTLVTVAPALRPANTYIFKPGQAVPAGLVASWLQVNIALADKLAVGNTIAYSFYVASDGFANWNDADHSTWNPYFDSGATWGSYGPGGIVAGGVSNPDPMFGGLVAGLAGKNIRVVLVTNNPMTIGVTVLAQ